MNDAENTNPRGNVTEPDPCSAPDLTPCEDRRAIPWDGVFDDGSGGRPVIKLEQRTERDFRLCSTLRFTGGPPGEYAPIVNAGQLVCSDLTSTPRHLRWFIGRYGPHTPAALVHDGHIGADGKPGYPRRQADRDFLTMLDALGLPPWRRWTMYAAVASATLYDAKGMSRVRILLWATLSVIGIVSLPVLLALNWWGPDAVVGRTWVWAVIAALAWIPAAALWGSDFWFGIVAGMTAVWAFPPTLFVAAGWLVYSAWDWLLIRIVDREPERSTNLMEFPST